MLAIIKAAAILVFLSAICTSQTSAGLFNWLTSFTTDYNSFVYDYDLINSALVDHVHDESALQNVLEALEWIQNGGGPTVLTATGEMQPDAQSPMPRKSALIQFTALIKLMDPNNPNCNLLGYQILKDNEQASGTAIFLPPNELGPLRRIDSVIHEVALQHANMCRYEYPDLFKSALESEPQQIIRSIESMMGAVIATSKQIVFKPKNRAMDQRQVDARKAEGVSMRGYAEAVALLLDLRHRSREDTDSRFLTVKPDPRRRKRWIVDEAKVVEMLTRYVYSRCEYLNKAFDHILRPCQLEQRLYSRETRYRAINDRTAVLMIWLQYYRLCNDLMANKRTVENNVIKAIWSELK